MNDINSINLVGRITRDFDLSYSQNALVMGTVSIAVNHSAKKNDEWVNEADFFDIQLFGSTAENLAPYLLKGKQIAVNGALRQNRWQKDGKNYSKVYIVAHNIQLLGGKKDSSNNEDSKPIFKEKPQAQNVQNETQGAGDLENFMEYIPF